MANTPERVCNMEKNWVVLCILAVTCLTGILWAILERRARKKLEEELHLETNRRKRAELAAWTEQLTHGAQLEIACTDAPAALQAAKRVLRESFQGQPGYRTIAKGSRSEQARSAAIAAWCEAEGHDLDGCACKRCGATVHSVFTQDVYCEFCDGNGVTEAGGGMGWATFNKCTACDGRGVTHVHTCLRCGKELDGV